MDRQHDDEQRQTQAEQGQNEDFDKNDFAWGREEIGKEIGRTPNQVTYLVSQGLLDGAVKRVGHRKLVASKRKLRALAARLIDQ